MTQRTSCHWPLVHRLFAMRFLFLLLALAAPASAQRLALGTYQITGAGVDTNATHPATHLVLPFDLPEQMGQIQSGTLTISAATLPDTGQRWRLSWSVIPFSGASAITQTAEGRVDGNDAGNVHQLVQDHHAEAMAYVHQQGTTFYLVTPPSLRFSIVRQTSGMIRKAD